MASSRKKLDIDIIEKAVMEMDYDVQEVYDKHMKVWAVVVINNIALFDPEIILIGGKTKPTNLVTPERIKRFVRKGTFNEPNIQPSEIGEKAALLGGLHIVKDHVLNHNILQIAINH